MALIAETNRIIRKLAKVSKRVRRYYADKGISERMKRRIERAVKEKGLMEVIMARRFAFGARHGSGSTKWKALTPNYLRWKLRNGYSATPNNRTYALLHAAEDAVRGTWKFSGEGPEWSGMVSTDAAGSVDYASYVNDVRPYDLDPSRKELEPTVKFVLQEVTKELKKMARGG